MPQPKIAFIIVTYNEVFYETISYKTLTAAIEEAGLRDYKIYIYDNSEKENWSVIYDSIERKESIFYHHDATNPGISVAYNKMATKAEKWGAEWIALFDQDTTLPLNIVTEYIKAIRNRPEFALRVPVLYVGTRIFSPMRLFFMRSLQLKEPLESTYTLSKYAFVNSGLMVYLPFFKKAGGYNEQIKLDFADFQFIERAKKYTPIFEVLPVRCEQNFSHYSDDIQKALRRFSIYIEDLSKCETDSINSIAYNISAFLHAMKLSYMFKSIKFIRIFFKEK